MSQATIGLMDKLAEIEREVSVEMGDFSLFGVFYPEGAAGQWDLLVAAPWLESGGIEALRHLTEKLQARLNPRELVSLSRVVVLNETDPFRLAVRDCERVEHGRVILRDFEYPGMDFRKVVLITNR